MTWGKHGVVCGEWGMLEWLRVMVMDKDSSFWIFNRGPDVLSKECVRRISLFALGRPNWVSGSGSLTMSRKSGAEARLSGFFALG